MPQLATLRALSGTVCMLAADVTHACTLCHTEVATAVRAAVFGPDMIENAGVAVLPFAVMIVIALIIHGRHAPQPDAP